MSNARPLVLPVMETSVQVPEWLRTGGHPAVEPLISQLTGETTPGRAESRQEHDLHGGPDEHAGESSDANPSPLPPPPSLGSLLPGGRSNPPPANDAASGPVDVRVETFAAAAIELAIARTSTLATLEGQLLDLAIDIASAIIDREVELDSELHCVLARAALRTLGNCARATLRTSPEAFAAVTEYIGGEHLEIAGVRVEIIADASIPGLGCIVDADHVRVDASVSARLRAVRIAFEDERRRKLGSLE